MHTHGMALVNWGVQAQLVGFEEEVVVVVPQGQPELLAKLKTVCANYSEWTTLQSRNKETFFTMKTKPGMGRRAYEHVLGVELSRAPPAGLRARTRGSCPC